MIWNVLGVLAAAYGGLALGLFVFQSRLVYYPEIDREVATTPAVAGLQYEDLHLRTSDGIDLHGWYVPAPQPRGTVLFLHGNAGNISHRIDSIEMFYRLGYSTLIFDYRGYGKSGGTPSETGTYRDAEAAWRYLTEQRHVPGCRIVLFGESLGGAVAAWLAATSRDTLMAKPADCGSGCEAAIPAPDASQRRVMAATSRDTLMAKPADCGSGCEAAIPAPDASQRRVMAARQKPAALVISSGFTSVPDLGQQLYPYLPVKLVAHIRYDTRESLRSVTAPVLIAHSPQDDIIPYEQGRALYAAANPPKQFLDLAGGHNDGFIFMREAWVKVLGDFLARHVNLACE